MFKKEKVLFFILILTLQIISASNFVTIEFRCRILHCLLYGMYGITTVIVRADDVFAA